MKIDYKVSDIDGGYHGTFTQLKDAQEQASEMAFALEKDMFIEETKTEIIECVIPKQN